MEYSLSRENVNETKHLLEEYVRLHPDDTSAIVTATLLGQTDRSLNELNKILEDELNEGTPTTNINTPSTRYQLKHVKELIDYLSRVPASSSKLRKYQPKYTPHDSGSENRKIATGTFTVYQLTDEEYAILYSKRENNTERKTKREIDVAFTTNPDQFFDWTLYPDNWYRKADIKDEIN